MKRAGILSFPLVLSSLAAQNTFVVPANLATRTGNWADQQLCPIGNEPLLRVQLLWDPNDVPVGAVPLKTLSLRRSLAFPIWSNVSTPAATWDIKVVLAMGPRPWNNPATDFATNLGTVWVQVFQGRVVLPATMPGPAPAPFLAQIPFTTIFPFVKAAGASLVADIRVDAYQPSPSQSRWWSDAQMPTNGAANSGSHNPLCKLGNGNYSNSYSYTSDQLFPGGKIWVEYPRLLPGAPGFVAFGRNGPSIDLTSLGAPNCTWQVGILFGFPAVCSAQGALRSPVLVVPNDPALASTGWYYHQGLVLDPTANSLGAVTTIAAGFTLGDKSIPRGTEVSGPRDQATGFVQQQAVVAQFSY